MDLLSDSTAEDFLAATSALAGLDHEEVERANTCEVTDDGCGPDRVVPSIFEIDQRIAAAQAAGDGVAEASALAERIGANAEVDPEPPSGSAPPPAPAKNDRVRLPAWGRALVAGDEPRAHHLLERMQLRNERRCRERAEALKEQGSR
jgi:hypothetical protein